MGNLLDFLDTLISLLQLSMRVWLVLLGIILFLAGILIPFDALAVVGLIILAGALLTWVWQLLAWLYSKLS